ncbi:MAG: divergent polysaccharide deacetylase family protein [Deltaproteobacteria bacterium]|nr:divergent polysaccharide deacetylase family protein [Deltaproteobacteria bacterium]MBZ0219765.1 divergent polysaccharide deacetylase family protein [Deltaproteobacteria bacterium]
MGKRRKKTGGYAWVLVVLGFIAGAAIAVLGLKYMGFERTPPERPRVSVPPPVRVEPEREPVPREAPPPIEEEPMPPGKAITPPPLPKLAVVIDDMGPDLNKLRELLKLDKPVTIAVMPKMRFSKEVSTEAASGGLDVIVHMPMEPKNTEGHNPGNGALLVAMTDEEIAYLLDEGFKSVPGAIGINNHMGSRFTEDPDKMRIVLKNVKERGLLFLDSRTSAETVGVSIARKLKVRSAERNVFLDNRRDVDYIKGQLMEAARIARKSGKAVAIGHPYPETIRALKEAIPGLEGVEVVRLSEIAE